MRNQNDVASSRFQEFLDSLNSMVGAKGRSLRIPSTDDQPPFWLVAYDAVPDEGSTTAFTFGISSVRHNSWQLGIAPELVISVNSADDDWWLSLGAFCFGLRGTCPFSLGNTLRLGERISMESEMTAFFLFWPTILQKDQVQMTLPDRTIRFAQAYPIFDSEVELISRIGSERFFMLDGLDFSDIRRQVITNPSAAPR